MSCIALGQLFHLSECISFIFKTDIRIVPALVPDQRTKIPQAAQHGQKKKKREEFGNVRQSLEQSPFLQFLACSASQHRLEE